MAKEKRPIIVKQGAPEYMNTYGDMVTLILCFFILMFASSSIDAVKLQEIAASLAGAPMSIFESAGSDGLMDMVGKGIMPIPEVTTKTGENKESDAEIDAKKTVNNQMSDLTEAFKTYMAEDVTAGKPVVEFDPGEHTIKITFPDGMMFDVGSAEIKPEILSYLDMVAEEFVKYPDYVIKVDGHTDSSPISTAIFKNNFYLSSYRATAVADYFIEQKGIDPFVIETGGYGEYKPIASNDTAEGRAKNRRVEINIIGTAAIEALLE